MEQQRFQYKIYFYNNGLSLCNRNNSIINKIAMEVIKMGGWPGKLFFGKKKR